MTSLNAAPALTALADVDVELPVDGLARDLDLELLGDVGFVEAAAAIGAGVGQGRLVNLVDLFGAGRLAVGLGAVVLTGLAAGLLGLVGRLSLGEGGGLALAGTERLVELAAEALVLGLQVVDASLKGLAVGTPDRFHAGIIRSSRTPPLRGVASEEAFSRSPGANQIRGGFGRSFALSGPVRAQRSSIRYWLVEVGQCLTNASALWAPRLRTPRRAL